eukprot:983797-Karenia_brevis.AAC.1
MALRTRNRAMGTHCRMRVAAKLILHFILDRLQAEEEEERELERASRLRISDARQPCLDRDILREKSSAERMHTV